MKQFAKVLRFEFGNYAKSKGYIIMTVVFVVLVAGLLTFPRVAGLFKGGEAQPPAETKVQLLAVSDEAYGGDGTLLDRLSQAFSAYQVKAVEENETVLQEKVAAGEYAAAIVIMSPLQFAYITDSLSIYDNPVPAVSSLLKEAYQLDRLEEAGIGAAAAAEIIHPTVDGTVTETGKSQTETIFYTYILIYGLYMAILLYGQFVATSVASEKSTRTMELLITSAKPLSLLFGKVIGTGLAGLMQFGIIFGSAFLFFNINADVWAGNPVIARFFNIPLDMLLFVLLFFVIGFFLYAFIYGALGSLASRTEDVGTAIMPVTFLFIIAFFVVMYGMGSGKLDSPIMIICSYIPFTSPMAMFTRIAMSNVAPLEIIISVAIAILSTIGTGFLSAAIYRVGILMYGKPPKLGELIKTLRSKQA
jgi:ABC-2 type transport system permease protein